MQENREDFGPLFKARIERLAVELGMKHAHSLAKSQLLCMYKHGHLR